MAFREKSAWVTLTSTVVVYGVYFAVASARLSAGAPAASFVAPLIAAILAIVVLQVGLTAVIAAAAPGDASAPLDERERSIQLRSTRAGFYTLQVGVFLAITTLFWGADARWIANGAFLAVVIAEVVRSGWRAIDYRRTSA